MFQADHLRVLTSFEVRQQWRDPLTWLYALVFLLLAAGFGSGGAVELVGNRGIVPVGSAWSIWLAFGGLTAFAQVITTMVAVTAVLRDESNRTSDMIAACGVAPSVWLAGRLAAALTVLVAVYMALPLGLVAGRTISVAVGDEPLRVLGVATARVGAAFAVLTIPSMLVAGTLVGVTAALTRRIVAALFVSLALLACWQLSLGLVEFASTRLLGALLDPFGNAPVLAVTSAWDAAAKSTLPMPLGGLLLANRLVWLSIAAAAFATGLRHVRWRDANATEPAPSPTTDALRVGRSPAAVVPDTARATTALPAPRGQARWQAAVSLARFTAQWIVRDGGWRAVAALAAANALLNAAMFDRDAGNGSDVLAALLGSVTEHARLFLIVLATVYAGEVFWRDRDTRTDQIIDAFPIDTHTMAIARLAGLLAQQARLVLWLAVGAALIASTRHLLRDLTSLWIWIAWTVFHLWAPFAQWTVLSLAVHVLVRHKVGAHLLLITGWVIAFALNHSGKASEWWYRYAEPAPLLEGGGLGWSSLLSRGGSWMAAAALLTVALARWWPRGSDWGPITSRR